MIDTGTLKYKLGGLRLKTLCLPGLRSETVSISLTTGTFISYIGIRGHLLSQVQVELLECDPTKTAMNHSCIIYQVPAAC